MKYLACRIAHSVLGCMLPALVLLFCVAHGLASTRVTVQMGSASKISCGKSYGRVLITGSVGSVGVTVLGDGDSPPFTGFPTEKPAWLNLEFSYGDDQGQFEPSAELYRLLNPVYYLHREQAKINEQFQHNGRLWPSTVTTPVYHFRFDVPEALAGKQICVRAVLTPPPFGVVYTYDHRDLACCQIFAPCSQEDRDHAMARHVIMAYSAGDDARVVALTDSLLQTGWKSKTGLSLALTSARVLGDPQKSLRFLDALFQNYGVTVNGRWQPGPEQDKMYRESREILLQKISEQEQQR